jgi:hypothetical protein
MKAKTAIAISSGACATGRRYGRRLPEAEGSVHKNAGLATSWKKFFL